MRARFLCYISINVDAIDWANQAIFSAGAMCVRGKTASIEPDVWDMECLVPEHSKSRRAPELGILCRKYVGFDDTVRGGRAVQSADGEFHSTQHNSLQLAL